MFRHPLLDKVVVLCSELTQIQLLKATYIPAFIILLFPRVSTAFCGSLVSVSQDCTQVLVGTVISSEAQDPLPTSFFLLEEYIFLAAVELTTVCFFQASRRISLTIGMAPVSVLRSLPD